MCGRRLARRVETSIANRRSCPRVPGSRPAAVASTKSLSARLSISSRLLYRFVSSPSNTLPPHTYPPLLVVQEFLEHPVEFTPVRLRPLRGQSLLASERIVTRDVRPFPTDALDEHANASFSVAQERVQPPVQVGPVGSVVLLRGLPIPPLPRGHRRSVGTGKYMLFARTGSLRTLSAGLAVTSPSRTSRARRRRRRPR